MATAVKGLQLAGKIINDDAFRFGHVPIREIA
jgi:hypothetical protein